MDNQRTIQILEFLHTLQEACPELYGCAEAENTALFHRLCGDAEDGLEQLLQAAKEENTPGNKKLRPAVQSLQVSLRRIRNYYASNRSTCLKKIEFELLPLLQEAYMNYYFFQYLFEHPEKLPQFYNKEYKLLCGNAYIDEAVKTGQYKYEVSLCVRGYNKLEYTKQCVESLLANIPEGLNYELILVNHGSCDGTKEYFESIHPHKQLDIAVNGGGVGATERIVEGEYMIFISNDVIITPYAIENLLACIRSDPKIAWAVPSTPNISNFQAISVNYKNYEELIAFAKKNNQSNPFRWEQRVRLCNPIDIHRSSVFLSSSGLGLTGAYHTTNPAYAASFPDDRFSLMLRRSGYKSILAKDAYCHHFGSVTLRDEIRQQNEQKYYLEGRREFFKAFGVDPWGTGFCYDPVFIERVVEEEHGHVDILGINCGLGSNSLKIKEQIKEYCHNMDTCLDNITDAASFLMDLKGISDKAELISSISEFKGFLHGHTYQYIVWETPFLTKYKPQTVLECCLNALSANGKLLIKLTDQTRAPVLKKFPDRKELGNDWVACGGGEKM